MPRSFSVGVLIIGSLYWDDSKERILWRENRLNPSLQFDVEVSIRYGRKSESRGNTYTMVFSPSCLKGRAKVVQCLSAISSGLEILGEAEALWAAERNSTKSNGQTSSWGCVTLMVNPNCSVESSILSFWARKTSNYSKLPCLPEEDPLIENGLLRIAWPNMVDDGPVPLDLLLATATVAEISGTPPTYPSAQTIANAWKISETKYSQYFLRNRENGIRTFQDNQIAKILGIPVF